VSQGIASLVIDRASPVPLYFQVAQHLEQLIESGAYPAGTRLENEIVLAERLGLSRPTMRRAIEYLVDRGLLVRKRGVGTQVVQPKVRRPVELSSLYDDLRAAGREPRTDVLSFGVERPAGAVAEVLGLADGSEVCAVKRLRYTGAEPLVIMRNYMPVGLAGIDPESLRTRGLYELLRGAGVNLKIATQTIGGRAAKPNEARLLNEKPGAALLTMTRTTYDDTGRAVEYGSHLYRASRYTFELTLTTG
jgi:DNA-binding GntR family transcriptional regulator